MTGDPSLGVVQAADGSTVRVTFYDSWAAFPHTRETDRDIHVTVDRLADPAATPPYVSRDWDAPGNYGFNLALIGSVNRRWSKRSPIGWQLQVFSDAWAALTDLPDLMRLLAELAGKDRGEQFTADQMRLWLAGLGYLDVTPVYEQTHHSDASPDHVGRCVLCGDDFRKPVAP